MSSIPFYARRWVSGTTMAEALEVVKKLNAQGIAASLDVLGENITDADQAMHFTNEYEALVRAMTAAKTNGHVSLKLTMLGLDVNEDLCFQNLSRILRVADQCDMRVALDMEGSDYTERTLRMYEQAAQTFRSPEIVLQAYLRRTEADVGRVLKANGRLRLCKGAYKESPQVAYQAMSDIVANYKRLDEKLLREGQRVCIATHDDVLIDHCRHFIESEQISRDRYEFQMLYGMREKSWTRIRQEGHDMTVYIPYGTHWQAYYSRRLMERKENVFFVLKNLFRS